jgi:hypothetical protein
MTFPRFRPRFGAIAICLNPSRPRICLSNKNTINGVWFVGFKLLYIFRPPQPPNGAPPPLILDPPPPNFSRMWPGPPRIFSPRYRPSSRDIAISLNPSRPRTWYTDRSSQYVKKKQVLKCYPLPPVGVENGGRYPNAVHGIREGAKPAPDLVRRKIFVRAL